jgi:hypothetical protein
LGVTLADDPDTTVRKRVAAIVRQTALLNSPDYRTNDSATDALTHTSR